ncbi:hypothetical protein FBU59_002494, partial [Linderina macrospora]
MAKKFKGENSKVTAAKEKKAAAQATKDSKKRSEREAKESVEWAVGSKKNDKKAEQEAKRQEKLLRKQEAEALLATENTKIAQSLKGKTGPPRLAPARPVHHLRGFEKKNSDQPATTDKPVGAEELAEEFAEESDSKHDSATDELLDKTAKQAMADSMAAVLDKHPERRAKAAFREFMEREKPRFKLEFPSLRLAQLKHQ